MGEERGHEPAPPVSAPEKVQAAKEFCAGLLTRLGGQVEVEVRETPEAIGVGLKPGPDNALELNGPLVEAVQYLANRVANPRAEGRKWVNLEVGELHEEANPVVKAMAARLAASAVRTGKVLAIAPMTARERRQIHLALVDHPEVSTRSEGEGLFRTLLIVPGKRGRGERG